MFRGGGSLSALELIAVVLIASIAPMGAFLDVGKGGEGEQPIPAQGTWSSLWEGDGVSSPSTEGWWIRTWGSVSVYSDISDGETVAVVDDPDPAEGGWMQKWVDLKPPFEFAARGRYDPLTTRTSPVAIAWMFTGCHRLHGLVSPTYLRIVAPHAFEVPAVQGQWYNLTFDVKAPLDVDVYSNGILIGNVEMNPEDRLSFDPPDNKPGVATIVAPRPTAKGMIDYVRTTMEPIQEVGPKVCDREPPLVLVTLDDGVKTPSDDLRVSDGVSTVWLNATIDDRKTGNSSIWSTNFTQGYANWPGTPLPPIDLQFDSPIENVSTAIDISGLGLGNYTFCIYGRDYYGNWNTTGSCAVMRIGKPQPPEIRELSLDINPDTLNLKSKGRWITAYLGAENASIYDVDTSSILLQDALVPERWDYQDDVLMLKFGRQDLIAMLKVGESVEIKLTGKWKDGTGFEAYDYIRVINPGRWTNSP